jgi:cystathionine beta-lyase/cystathionine gamma-synthase
MEIETKSLHSDKRYSADVSAPIHVSTTYKYPPGYNNQQAIHRGWVPKDESASLPDFHIYSRMGTETRDRLEQVLGSLEKSFAVTYSSGLSAIFGLFEYLQPTVKLVHNKESGHVQRRISWYSSSS